MRTFSKTLCPDLGRDRDGLTAYQLRMLATCVEMLWRLVGRGHLFAQTHGGDVGAWVLLLSMLLCVRSRNQGNIWILVEVRVVVAQQDRA